MTLEMQNLTKRYRDKLALRDVSLTLTPGLWGLLGPNGAGKSTMMNIIAGVLTQTSGRVLWDGKPIGDIGAAYRAVLGFLPQSPGLYDAFTARQYLRYLCALKGVYQKKGEKRALEEHIAQTLEDVNLTPDADRRTGAFSGGMKQRLVLAQALLGSPEILVLDEPTSGLDPQERVRLRALLAGLAENKVVLWSTHIVGDIESVAHQVILLRQGQCVFAGTPGKEGLESLYLQYFESAQNGGGAA
jgi:ABC-type multidrug transport system ATPase subunit